MSAALRPTRSPSSPTRPGRPGPGAAPRAARGRWARAGLAAAVCGLIGAGGAQAAVAAPAAPVAAPAAAAAAPVVPVGVLRVSTTRLRGTKGSLSWDVTVPRFTAASSAGSARAAAVTARVRASALATVRATARSAASGDGTRETLTGTSAVTTNDGRTVQVRFDYADYAAGAAHPNDVVETVALVARTARPITAAQVLTSPTAAYTTLAAQVEAIASAAGEPVTEHDGLAPTAANWANWQTTRAGMVFAFEDYQLGGHGVRTYAVPWSSVTPLMTPSARALLAPTS